MTESQYGTKRRSEDTATGEAVCLWQKDARELQLATAAVRAGILVLLKHAGVKPEELETVLLVANR